MPQSQEKTPEQTTELPNPELNPLLNPTLGRHLGRWAQVYFTSPPEKREEAVEELLRELQGDSPATQETIASMPADSPTLEAVPVETIRIVEGVAAPSSLKCDECGHLYTASQRFCGMCGATLAEEPAVSTEPIPRGHSARTVEPAFTHADLPSLSPVVNSVNPPDDGYSDIRWLREKSLSDSGSSWRRARYAPAIIAVLAIGILFYAQSRPSNTPGQPAAKATHSAPESARLSTPTPASTPAETAPVEKAEEATPATPHEPARSSPDQIKPPVLPPTSAADAVDNPRPPAGNRAPSASQIEPSASLNPANGTAELAMAEDFLSGKTHPRNSEEAAKYLWRAVGKENPTAILLLSDMYQAGDGVPKSCDQARLLLSAAAKKGVPQAAAKLGDLLRSGCPK